MASDHHNVDDIYLAALELADTERAAFLDKMCGDNAELRSEVEQLLESAPGVDSFQLTAPGNASPTTDPPIIEAAGSQIGPYKLLQQIGEGGMGIVYMAEQKEPVKRRVALKIIKPGMDTRQVIARFEAERQALAMMDHPGIAKVLDAGATDSGRPYFVMELVNGPSVTDYCDRQRLTPSERLKLFMSICQAVQHAHQKGIIHRDLKPSNILVGVYDGRPVPKVIDFGVAKATTHTLTEKTLYTQHGQVIGTLEYMSPEQAEQDQLDIDTRSDIYSLGVVLYELLVGEPPFDRRRLRTAAFKEMLRILREENPPKPSTKLSSSQSLASIAANRHIEPARLTGTIRGDLDWIVLKAMEKERSRRYDSASAFSDDISRYLDNETVTARPPSKLYRFRKFAVRNRASLLAACAVLLALLIGLAGVSWQLVRVQRAELIAQSEREVAEEEREAAQAATELAAANLSKARAAVHELIKVASQLSDVPEAQPIRRELVDSALVYYEDFLRSHQNSPDMQADVASTHLHVGRLKSQLGNFRSALSSFDSAEAILKAQQDEALNARFRRILASVYFDQGWTRLQLRDTKMAVTSFNNAVQLRKALVDELTQESDQLDLARDYHNLAISLQASGDSKQASVEAEKSLKVAQQLLELQPDSYAYRTRVARISGYLGALNARLGEWAVASPHFHLTADIHNQLIKDNPNDRDCYRRVAVAADWLARLAMHNQDFKRALKEAQRATQIGEELVELFPTRFRYRSELADHYLTLAHAFEANKERSQAHEAYKSAIASYRVLADKNASYTGLLRALNLYGENCLNLKEYEQAVAVFRDQLKLTVEADLSKEARIKARTMLGAALAKRGLELFEKETPVAERDLEQAVAYLENAHTELNSSGENLSDDSKAQLVGILELLVEIHKNWNKQAEADKWQAKLDSVKAR